MLERKQGTPEDTSLKQLAPDWTEKNIFVLFYPISGQQVHSPFCVYTCSVCSSAVLQASHYFHVTASKGLKAVLVENTWFF